MYKKYGFCLTAILLASIVVFRDVYRENYDDAHPIPLATLPLNANLWEKPRMGDVNEGTKEPEENFPSNATSSLTTASLSGNTQWDLTSTDPSTEDSWKSEIERRFNDRKASVRARCGQVGKYPYSVRVTSRRSLYYTGKYDLVVCVIAKSGASTWKTHLLRMGGVTESTIGNPHSLKYSKSIHALTQLGYVKLQGKLQSPFATRVMTARHPLSRLVSAYRDKFFDGQAAPRYPWVSYIKRYCRDCRNDRGSLAFPQFLRLVLAEKAEKGIMNLNRHWRPYSSICSPCDIHYDYILKQETFDDDLRFVTEVLDLKEVELGTRNNNKSNRTHLPTYLDYYRNVSRVVLDRIFNLYETDFRIFDYDIPESLLAKVKE